jgi:hypothetical protein
VEGPVLRHRGRIYAFLNIIVLLAAVFGVMFGNASAGSATYACVLFMLCSVPALWLQRFNDRYALLAIFMGVYFLLFGALSLRNVLLGPDVVAVADRQDAFMTAAQIAVILGAALVLAGYRFGSSLVRPRERSEATTDFSNFAIVGIGLLCWTLGSAAQVYYAIFVVPENTTWAARHGFEIMGPLLTFAVMLANLVQPFGVVVLAYGYAKNRTAFWLGLVVAMVFLQLVLGFITDTKGTALMGILLVAITQTLWDNKLPKGWMAVLLVFAILIFPVLQAERVVRGERGYNRAQAFEHVTEVLAYAWESRQRVNEGQSTRRAQTFLERSSGEASLEPLFERVGVDTPFLNGATLVELPYAFIPRLLVPDKKSIALGQLYNHVFLHAASDDFTYISVSVLGEFYWNFGWPGVVGGTLLTGLIMGITGAKSSLAEVPSLTRLLILLVSIMQLCFGFGGSIGVSYVLWLRAVAAIGLMHALFTRPASSVTNASNPLVKRQDSVAPAGSVLPLFPNIMR